MPLAGDEAAAVHYCNSGLADGLVQHPQGQENLDP